MDRLPSSVHLIKHPVAFASVVFLSVVIAAIAGVGLPIILILLVVGAGFFVALVKYAPELRLEDEHLFNYIAARFSGFHGEATQENESGEVEEERGQEADNGELDEKRIQEYESNRGLFLVHEWRPSGKQGQVADVIISLVEHRDTSTRPSLLEGGDIECVSYELGRRFSETPIIKSNASDRFKLEVSAYRPMLCSAKVTFKDSSSIYLSRYIDFADLTHDREVASN